MSTPTSRQFTFQSRGEVFDFFRACQYDVAPVDWDFSELPQRARELIGAMRLVSHYDDPVAPFQIFLVELNVPREVKRIRRTDLRTILDPFYRRYPQGDYLFVFALPGYNSLAFVSPKRIHDERQKHRDTKQPLFPDFSPGVSLPQNVAIKTQLRILTLDPRHLYHTDQWVLEQIRLGEGDQTAPAIWHKHLQAFDVERITRQFYGDYKAILDGLKAELHKQAKEVAARPADVHAFAQQLLNRLMFLYFVQKKDWLRWNGGPDRHYLCTLWRRYRDAHAAGKAGFYTWLQALFLDAFNKQRAAIAANRALPDDVRMSFQNMPFLNGGLFERNAWDDLNFDIPDRFFAALFDRFRNEEPGFLERYNFTVDESTALEVEVAVDPEMLGKVYESLVQEEERHGAGIFYTPREEIDYMCRLSLIEYLHERTQLSKDDLIPLVMEPRRLLDAPADGIMPFAGLSEAKRHETLRAVESALRQVRMVDPGVGSGSFLVGMMKVLAELQQVIAERLERKRFNEFDLKRRIIMENLYGVDVKDWAVRVCELRLWLALTIEAREDQIGLYTQPVLPKLSFRVRTGDSLVEEVAATPLVLRGAGRMPILLQKRLQELAQDKEEFFSGRGRKKLQVIEKDEQKLLTSLLNEQIARLDAQMQDLRGEQLGLAGVADERARRKQADSRRLRLKELTARYDALLKARAELATGKTPPFFVWDVGFGEVFAAKGGFDIVIGNPPYVRQEEIAPPTLNQQDYSADDWRARKQAYKDQLARSVAALWGDAVRVDRKSDLYVYFYYVGLSLLRPGGVFCFINSNSWLDVDYGAELQEFLLRHMRIGQIIDNRAERSFAESDVNTVIVLLQRPRAEGPCWEDIARFVAYKEPFEDVATASNLLAIERASDVTNNDDLRVYPIAQRDLLLEGAELPEEAEQMTMDFVLEALKYQGGKWGGKFLKAPNIFFVVLEKARETLTCLGRVGKVRYPIKTGINEFFYLEEETVHRFGIEEEFLFRVVKSPKEFTRIQLDITELQTLLFCCQSSKSELKQQGKTGALRYIEWGERQVTKGRQKTAAGVPWPDVPSVQGREHWYSIESIEPADIVCNRFFDRRLFFGMCTEPVIEDQTFYGLVLHDKSLKYLQVALLNSTLSLLFVELLGRVGLGEGVLQYARYEMERLVTLAAYSFRSEAARLGEAFLALAQRNICSIFEELGLPKPNRDYSNIDPANVTLDKVLPDRRALDAVVFEALELTDEEQLEVYRAVVELVKNRLTKARSV